MYQINLLGPWQVLKDGVVLTEFRGDSVRALLTYILLENKSPQARRFLANLLWEDLEEEASMRNVRVSLTRLKKGLDEENVKQPLVYSDRQSIGIDPSAKYNLDIDAFEEAIGQARRAIQPNRPPDRRVLARLKRAVALYRADFLQGFYHPSLPFEDWMLVRRERFHNDALWALHTLADQALRVQDWHTAVTYAQRQLDLEAWREEAFQQLMQAQLGLGERTAAVASFERCKQVLWNELALEPASETIDLYEQAAAGESEEQVESNNPHNLPAATDNFFSRQTEIDFLLKRLGDPDGRLTTILGEGGVGKSRLSQYVGLRVIRDFIDGVWFIPFDHLESLETREERQEEEIEAEMVQLMVDTLKVPLAGNRPVRDQLLGWLERKEILLIFDNFETVIGATPFVKTILDTAEDAVIITTSRETLNLSQEVLLPLRGLDVVAQADTPEHSPAVRLFIDRAERVGAPFEQDEETLQAITKTCELVDGNALAIELAAVWMRQMSAQEILTAVQESIDFLEARHSDIPERHRSMRAVFDQTWTMLPLESQHALARLSIFQGGFASAAAKEVAGCDRKMLAQLHDRSLIQRYATGRYELRPLVRQYAAERFTIPHMVRGYANGKLDPEVIEQTQQAHASWFLTFMAEQKADLMGAKPWDAIQRIELEIDNIRQGWEQACGTVEAHADGLLAAAEPLSEYFNIRGRFQEALDLFEMGSKGVVRYAPASQLSAHFAMHKSRFLVRLGRYKDGEQAAEEAVKLARRVNDDWCVAMAYVWWCQAFWEQGLTNEALAVLEKGEPFKEKARDEYLNGRYFHHLSVIFSMQGRSNEALNKAQNAVNIFSALKFILHQAFSLNTLGVILQERGDFNGANLTFDQVKGLIDSSFMPSLTGIVSSNLALTFQELNNYSLAQESLESALKIYEDLGLRARKTAIYVNMAILFCETNQLNMSEAMANKAINLANEFGNNRAETYSAVTLGNINLKRKDFKSALSHYLNAAEISDQNHFQQLKAEILFGIAQCFIGLEDKLQAKSYAENALELAESTHQLDLQYKIEESLQALV